MSKEYIYKHMCEHEDIVHLARRTSPFDTVTSLPSYDVTEAGDVTDTWLHQFSDCHSARRTSTRSHARTRARTRTRTHAHAHARAHTHEHPLGLSGERCGRRSVAAAVRSAGGRQRPGSPCPPTGAAAVRLQECTRRQIRNMSFCFTLVPSDIPNRCN